MNEIWIGIAAVLGTIVCYQIGQFVHKKWPVSFTAPVIVATPIVIIFLLSFDIPYETYMIGGEWINQLLGPAVVALAYPLYQHWSTLKKLTVPLLSGTLVGAFVGVASGMLLAVWADVDGAIFYSLLPKNATTAVAMDVAVSLGGVGSLAAVFVMIAGVGGVMISSFVFKLFGPVDSIGRGIGIGSASHAIGTASAMENSELEGSIATIAMVVSAVAVSIIVPLLVMVFM
ncbi:LrgB family protein [Lentibacillus sediminis]|uniref:LrgB family protein n=1 Tax=Lentibacillus sediminis TaxID=1940529 RepID=UPI000C1BF02C|nr:LrgB family protein [Lentibacillus sediminis]